MTLHYCIPVPGVPDETEVNRSRDLQFHDFHRIVCEVPRRSSRINHDLINVIPTSKSRSQDVAATSI